MQIPSRAHPSRLLLSSKPSSDAAGRGSISQSPPLPSTSSISSPRSPIIQTSESPPADTTLTTSNDTQTRDVRTDRSSSPPQTPNATLSAKTTPPSTEADFPESTLPSPSLTAPHPGTFTITAPPSTTTIDDRSQTDVSSIVPAPLSPIPMLSLASSTNISLPVSSDTSTPIHLNSSQTLTVSSSKPTSILPDLSITAPPLSYTESSRGTNSPSSAFNTTSQVLESILSLNSTTEGPVTPSMSPTSSKPGRLHISTRSHESLSVTASSTPLSSASTENTSFPSTLSTLSIALTTSGHRHPFPFSIPISSPIPTGIHFPFPPFPTWSSKSTQISSTSLPTSSATVPSQLTNTSAESPTTSLNSVSSQSVSIETRSRLLTSPIPSIPSVVISNLPSLSSLLAFPSRFPIPVTIFSTLSGSSTTSSNPTSQPQSDKDGSDPTSSAVGLSTSSSSARSTPPTSVTPITIAASSSELSRTNSAPSDLPNTPTLTSTTSLVVTGPPTTSSRISSTTSRSSRTAGTSLASISTTTVSGTAQSSLTSRSSHSPGSSTDISTFSSIDAVYYPDPSNRSVLVYGSQVVYPHFVGMSTMGIVFFVYLLAAAFSVVLVRRRHYRR